MGILPESFLLRTTLFPYWMSSVFRSPELRTHHLFLEHSKDFKQYQPPSIFSVVDPLHDPSFPVIRMLRVQQSQSRRTSIKHIHIPALVKPHFPNHAVQQAGFDQNSSSPQQSMCIRLLPCCKVNLFYFTQVCIPRGKMEIPNYAHF